MKENSEGVSIKELMHNLNVSRRTVYRELSSLEDTLKNLDLMLEKEGKLHGLRGSETALQDLSHELQEPLAIEWADVDKRQIALFGMIVLQTEARFSSDSFVQTFNVSMATIQQDINYLNKVLTKYNIAIKRTDKQTFYVSGSEVYIRLYLSQILSYEINEFDFFQMLEQKAPETIETESQFLLSLMDSSLLQMVYQAFNRQQPELSSKISDDILMNFLIMMTISLIRLKNKKTIKHLYSIDHDLLFPYVQQILSVVKVFESSYKKLLNTAELSFFAMQLRGINAQQSHSIFQQSYDMELGYNIKYLIRLVSSEFAFNFNRDNVLYHDLINHIGAALKRLELNLPEIENEVLTKLKQQYPNLYSTVEEKLIEVFSPTIFSEQEIGYVVTHFASSFEKHEYRRDLKILVVCTSGIGTSKILKTRLERSIPEIKHIDVVRAIDLNEVDIDQYEVIFSTIMLTGFEHNYTLINPILDDQEIEMIKQRLSQHTSIEKVRSQPSPVVKTKGSYKKVKQFMDMTASIIENFEVLFVAKEFEDLADYLDEEFKNHPTLKKKINKRLESSPLAIPESGIMLLHTTDKQITQPILKLQELKYPLEAIGMDREPTMVNRMIVMLGPETMDEMTTDFLGTISSSLIEKEEYIKVYQNGSTEELKELFEHLSVEILTKLLQ